MAGFAVVRRLFGAGSHCFVCRIRHRVSWSGRHFKDGRMCAV
jgi:hypothetical protein